MSAIKNVALAGATGNLGPSVLQALLDANFNVTVLTRASSTSKFASNVTVKVVDYDSVDSLTAALKGQDALVSTLSALAVDKQKMMVDAAITAGVQRLIPSEFGCALDSEPSRSLPVFQGKIDVQKYIEEKAAAGLITYTCVWTNAFLDWGLMVGFVLNVKGGEVELYDGGDVEFSSTRLPAIGKAVAGVLKHPDGTKNRSLRIHEAVTTQNKLLAMAKKIAPEKKFEPKTISTATREKEAREALSKGVMDEWVWVAFIQRAIWGQGYSGVFKTTDNKLLGVEEISDKEIESEVAKYCK